MARFSWRSKADRFRRARVVPAARSNSLAVDHSEDDIHDVGAGWPGGEERASSAEHGVRVVLLERARGVVARALDGGPCRRIDERTGDIGGAVTAVGSGSEDGDTQPALPGFRERARCGERELLTTTAR